MPFKNECVAAPMRNALRILIKLTEALNKVCMYLRVGEIAMSNLNSNHIVKISDVAFDSKTEILYVAIISSKTDQLGHQTTLILKRSVHTSLCPVNLRQSCLLSKRNIPLIIF
jgi:hypothetical protein